jgi:hypothetical protein
MEKHFAHTIHLMSFFDPVPVNGAVRSNEPSVNNTLRTPFKIQGNLLKLLRIVKEGKTRIVSEQSSIYEADGDEEEGPIKVPEMWADMQLPEFAHDLFELQMANVWLGNTLATRTNRAPPKSSPLHFDGTDNLLYQLTGHKKLVLFSNQDSYNLCPETMNTTSAVDPRGRGPEGGPSPAVVTAASKPTGNFASVNLNRVDLDRCPGFVHAKPALCTLNPGEVLYMPSGMYVSFVGVVAEVAAVRWEVEGAVSSRLDGTRFCCAHPLPRLRSCTGGSSMQRRRRPAHAMPFHARNHCHLAAPCRFLRPPNSNTHLALHACHR